MLPESLYLDFRDWRKTAVVKPYRISEATSNNAVNVTHVSGPVPAGFYFLCQAISARGYSAAAVNVVQVRLNMYAPEAPTSAIRLAMWGGIVATEMGVFFPGEILIPEGYTFEVAITFTAAAASNNAMLSGFGYLIPPLDL